MKSSRQQPDGDGSHSEVWALPFPVWRPGFTRGLAARGAALVIPGDMKAKFYEGYQRVLAELNKATETK